MRYPILPNTSHYNHWTILSFSHIDKFHKRCYLCRCDCGTERTVEGADLVSGKSRCCGCVGRAAMRGNKYSTHHGQYQTKTYSCWVNMKKRCYNPKMTDYDRWGGRGITVCDRWRNSFEAFYEDMGDCAPELSLDRINNDGNYEPGNCRWATVEEQARNRHRPSPR